MIRARELLYYFVWRDVKIRYKQTVLGVAWAVLQPLFTMIVFTLIFGRMANMAAMTGGAPYPVFVFTGLIFWTFFSGSVTVAGMSLITQQHLLTKVYFPRLFIPIACIGTHLVDLLISLVILAILMAFQGAVPSWQAPALVPLIGLMTMAAIGVGCLCAAMRRCCTATSASSWAFAIQDHDVSQPGDLPPGVPARPVPPDPGAEPDVRADRRRPVGGPGDGLAPDDAGHLDALDDGPVRPRALLFPEDRASIRRPGLIPDPLPTTHTTMSRPAIVVDELSKSYRLGAASTRVNSFREVLTRAMTSPLRRLRETGEARESEAQTFWALRDVSFEVQPGEVVGIIGRNGAGKSTLLKILSRIVEPTGGSIRLRGRVASLLEVGTGFHPELTGRENIFLNGSILGMKKFEIDRRFDEIVDFSGIERFLDTPVKRYSSGMYVRLAFAVAAHLEPEILIVDEVLAVGDVEFQKKCLGKMKEVTGEGGRTVLFVSHNLTSVRALCDRVIWLNGGKIVIDGAAGPAVESYLSESLSGDEGVYDLDGHDRQSSLGSLLRLRRLTLNEGNPVRHGVPLKIEIDYRTNSDVDGVAFGLGFSSHEGARILTIDSDAPGERFAIRRDTTGRAEMTIPELQLQPGRYALDIAARSGESVSLDYMPGFAAVEVLPGPDTPAMIVGRAEAGSVRIPATCHHFPASSAASVTVS